MLQHQSGSVGPDEDPAGPHSRSGFHANAPSWRDGPPPHTTQGILHARYASIESAVSAALLSNYGKTLIQLERFAEAVPVLEEAVAMARTHAGTGSLHYASATAGLSRARFEAGELGRAAREADQALADVRAVVGEDHPAVAVLKVEIGRLRAAQGRTEQADRLLTQAQSVLAALGAAGAPQIETIERIRARYHLPRS